NGSATILATQQILGRFRKMLAPELKCSEAAITFQDERVFVDGEATEWTWEKVVEHAYLSRVALSAHAFFATPRIHFDSAVEKGHPFAYHVYGVTYFEVTVDCLRGRYEFDEVRMVHD